MMSKFVEESNEKIFLDCKEQYGFQYDSCQIMVWLEGIAVINRWTWLLDSWTMIYKRTIIASEKNLIQAVFKVTIELQYAN